MTRFSDCSFDGFAANALPCRAVHSALAPLERLHLVAAHVFVVEAFEPAAELLGCRAFGWP